MQIPDFPAYAELCCQSNFSFLSGASHPEELVERAAELGYTALALTDECSLAGVVRAHLEIRNRALPLHLIVGTKLILDDGMVLVLLATDRAGYGRLSRLITTGRRRAAKGGYRLGREDLEAGLPGCLAILLPPEDQPDPEPLLDQALWLGERFPGATWVGISLVRGCDDEGKQICLEAVAEVAGLRATAVGEVLMHKRARKRIADVLVATRLRLSLDEAEQALAPNAENYLHNREILGNRYTHALLAESLIIAAHCHFSLDELRDEYPAELVPGGETPASWLRRLTEGGLAWRYGPDPHRHHPAPGAARPPAPAQDPAPPAVRAQIEHELALIAELAYEPYFLTVHDIVGYARSQGILCQGRGSAANSVVCWALGITEVDPGLGIMLVERFISRERAEPPDIDVDFEHARREEVIQYIYRKYGRERAALTATVITYRARSAIRDVARALGFDLELIERLTRDPVWYDGKHVLPEGIAATGLNPQAPLVRHLIEITEQLIGFPRHLSQHVGGFVIARGRLDELVPVENAGMPGRTVIQWDKDDLDALGLLKIDVLALGMLTALRRSLDLVAARRGQPFGLADIPREDPAVYAMLARADAIGVFQVESRAQLTMLPRLRPRTFYDLVVEVAIVRPGPIQGGMVHPYLDARATAAAGRDPLAGLRPEIRRVLARTLGVPIFQEQVMQLAVIAAGFSPGDADQLRRAMGAWRRQGELERYRAQLLSGMAARGYAADFAERLCRQIEGFGSYGFPESHAASFALLVYFSAWLKCHEPAAFLCALLNSQPMGFYRPSQLIQDARRHGVAVHPADVSTSAWECRLEEGNDGPAVRLGLCLVKGLARAAGLRIVAAQEDGPCTDVQTLASRAELDQRTLRLLAGAGALASLSGNRRQALWQAAGARPLPGLLHGVPIHEEPVSLPPPREADDLLADYARLGFTLGRHPLALLRPRLAAQRFLTAREIADSADRRLARAAGLVSCRQRPGTAKGILFVTLEDETGLVNVIVAPELLAKQRRILLDARLLGVYGQVTRQGTVVHLRASRVVDQSHLLGDLDARSRDFR